MSQIEPECLEQKLALSLIPIFVKDLTILEMIPVQFNSIRT